MHDYERIHYIHNSIRQKGYVTKQEIVDHFEISRSTFTRDIAFMKDRLKAPITFMHSEPAGYYYNPEEKEFELAGVWLTAQTCHALIVMNNLLSEIIPTVPTYDPFHNIGEEIHTYLKDAGYDPQKFLDRIKYKSFENRTQNPESFQRILAALLTTKRVSISYHSRSKDERTTRTISPQTLIYYRNNWYLAAYCHMKNKLRTFAAEMITNVIISDQEAKLIPNSELQKYMSGGFGIFSGGKPQIAHLRFSKTSARWVKDEIWHIKQEVKESSDGTLEMKIPYSNVQEISMEIMRHLPEVEVLNPKSLKETIKARIQKAYDLYNKNRNHQNR